MVCSLLTIVQRVVNTCEEMVISERIFENPFSIEDLLVFDDVTMQRMFSYGRLWLERGGVGCEFAWGI